MIEIRQTLGNLMLQVAVTNNYGRRIGFPGLGVGLNIYVNLVGTPPPVPFSHIEIGETITRSYSVRTWPLKEGDQIKVLLVEEHQPDMWREIDWSNEIIYEKPIPIEAIGAGLGAVVGGVTGYILKPVDPVISALIGAGLGGGAGYGLAYLATTGITEIPPIPALGAAPEGPGAPARLGKYLITG